MNVWVYIFTTLRQGLHSCQKETLLFQVDLTVINLKSKVQVQETCRVYYAANRTDISCAERGHIDDIN